MGAICWHGTHQNSKNSTNCKPPEARLTVVGSVASRFGPREVATGSGAGVGDSFTTGGWVATAGADSTVGEGIALGNAVEGAGAG